jgi:hypothetical protein
VAKVVLAVGSAGANAKAFNLIKQGFREWTNILNGGRREAESSLARRAEKILPSLLERIGQHADRMHRDAPRQVGDLMPTRKPVCDDPLFWLALAQGRQ